MSIYTELSLLSLLNIETASWDSPYKDERYSNIVSIIIIVLLSAAIYITRLLYIKRENWRKGSFIEKFGTLLEGADTSKKQNKLRVVALLAIFFLRKIALTYYIVKFADYLWL